MSKPMNAIVIPALVRNDEGMVLFLRRCLTGK